MDQSHKFSGALTCTRYAFAPNYYHYCGPDTRGDLGEYLQRELADGGLVEYLSKFETLYPYLRAIAAANGISDPLDKRVVEAYWVGNGLLEKVSERDVFKALTEFQHLPKRLPKKEMGWLLPKIDRRARLHHSFHVFNVFARTGHHTVKQTVETMDECRVSWGKVTNSNFKFSISNQFSNLKLTIKSQKIGYEKGKMEMRPAVREVMVLDEPLAKRLKPGDWVSVHWGFVCDKLTAPQVRQLEKYTLHHLKLANETI
jgi:hydrogenase maturation factor